MLENKEETRAIDKKKNDTNHFKMKITRTIMDEWSHFPLTQKNNLLIQHKENVESSINSCKRLNFYSKEQQTQLS